MPKAEFGTAKYLSKQLKAKGLQKLRFYCQVCEKQCRDENGFKSHIRSPSHLRNISEISEEDIDEYTKQFESDFIRLLKQSHGEKKIGANKFYNQFIQDKNHIHMNATRYTSLTKFIQHLGNQGKIVVNGLDDISDSNASLDHVYISFVDNSSENALRKATIESLEANESSEQEIKAKLLKQQLQRAQKAIAEESHSVEEESPISQNYEVGKVAINLNSMANGGKVSKKRSKLKKKNVFK